MLGDYRVAAFASRVAVASALVLSTAVARPAAAWSEVGHRAIARMAQGLISPATHEEADRLLGGESLAAAAVWADRARNEPAWEWTWRLHFVNVPDDASALDLDRDCPARGCEAAPPGGPLRCCVVGALEHYLEVLADPGRTDLERAVALRFVLHFAGDLHQPLHVSRATDRGGNEIDVTFFGEPMDLHDVWDRELLERRAADLWAATDERSIAARLAARLVLDPVDDWRRGDPRSWAQESLGLALGVAYEVGPPPHRLGAAYHRRARPVAEEQMRKAAVRLATLLDRALAP